MKILVKTLSGRTTYLEVEPQDDIMNVMHKIQDKEGIPPMCQHLLFCGVRISDNPQTTLSDLNVQRDSVLHLLPRGRIGSGGRTYEYAAIQLVRSPPCISGFFFFFFFFFSFFHFLFLFFFFFFSFFLLFCSLLFSKMSFGQTERAKMNTIVETLRVLMAITKTLGRFPRKQTDGSGA